MTFNEFYKEVYLPAHKHPLTVRFHSKGVDLMVLSLCMAGCLYNTPIWLGLVIFGVGMNIGLAIISHNVFEKNRPVFINTPKYMLYAILSELRLWWNN